MHVMTRLRSVVLAAAILTPFAAWSGLTAPLRVTQNIAGTGTAVVSAGLRPGGAVRVRGSGSQEVEVRITFVDAGGPVEVRQRGTFAVDIPVSGRPASSAVHFRMINQSRQNVLYSLNAD